MPFKYPVMQPGVLIMLKMVKSVYTKVILALGALLTGLEELLETLIANFESFLEVHHGVILISAIHIFSAFESFLTAHAHTHEAKDHLRRGGNEE